MLWQKADPTQIPSFSEQIRLTRNAISDNLLLIEEEHYNKLIQLIEQFDKELIKNGLIKEEYRNILTQYNDKLLNENVICDTHQCVNLMEKYEKINI